MSTPVALRLAELRRDVEAVEMMIQLATDRAAACSVAGIQDRTEFWRNLLGHFQNLRDAGRRTMRELELFFGDALPQGDRT